MENEPVALYPVVTTMSFTDEDGDTLRVTQDTVREEPRVILWVVSEAGHQEGVSLTPAQLVELGEHLIDQGQDLL